MPVRDMVLKQVYCDICQDPGPSAVTEAGAKFDATVVGWDVGDKCLCPKHKDARMFGVREVIYLKCSVCDWEGPGAMSREDAAVKGLALGADIIFGFCQCPRCSELGRLPADVVNAIVTLPTAADVPAVVEGQS